jgi:hypothetical protein
MNPETEQRIVRFVLFSILLIHMLTMAVDATAELTQRVGILF